MDLCDSFSTTENYLCWPSPIFRSLLLLLLPLNPHTALMLAHSAAAGVCDLKDTLQFCSAVSDTRRSVSWCEWRGGSIPLTRTTSELPVKRFRPARGRPSSWGKKNKEKTHKHRCIILFFILLTGCVCLQLVLMLLRSETKRSRLLQQQNDKLSICYRLDVWHQVMLWFVTRVTSCNISQ